VRAALFLLVVLVAAAALVGGPPARADDAEAPVSAKVAVDDRDIAVTGLFTLKIEFTPVEDVARPYSVQILLATKGRTLVTLRHAPPTPSISWKKGVPVAYSVETPFPFDANLADVDEIEIWLGLVDAETGESRPPSGGNWSSKWHAQVATLKKPRPVGDADVTLAAADAMAKEGKKDAAWNALDLGLRCAADDPTKTRFRDAMAKLGSVAAPPLSFEEKCIVEQRIADEKRRVLRETAGRFFDQKHYHAALRLLEEIGGKLAQEGGAAVVGALNAAKRIEKDAQDIREKLVESVSPEEQAEAEAGIKLVGLSRDLLRRADEWAKAKKFGAARFALDKLYRGADGPLSQAAYGRLKDVEKQWIATTPPDEQALVDAAVNHPSFARTTWIASREFVFIGPKTLVEGISAQSKLRYDLAYVFLTDLFGRRPNPGGDRVTVYFKELFDFGGGIGGGKTIDIGRANPDAKDTRVDVGLLYHELTHCIDDTNPIYEGFREGLANFGAAFTFEALGQNEDLLHAFATNLDAFKKDYLARDLEYWRIENYGPSAGFFLWFVDKYAKTKSGAHDWSGWRRFFRGYRDAPVKDGREPFVVRVFAHHLVAAFGPGAFDDLIAFRFPLVPADRDAVETESEAYALGGAAIFDAASRLADSPNSPFPRDDCARRMLDKMQSGDADGARAVGRDELGIVYDWRGIGPFQQAGADPGSFAFPPEHEIDFARDYPGKGNVCKWTEAGETGAVKIDAAGWVTFDYSYQEETSSYALTHATVPADTDAWAWFRADDDLVLFVNGELIDGYDGRWIEATQFPWRGPVAKVPDAMRLPVSLKKGRNRILVKVRNHAGPSGFVFALSRRDGKPIAGLATDRDPPSPPVARETPPPDDHWKRVLKHEFDAKQFASTLAVAVGKFAEVNKTLVGEATDKAVAWRKYTVRPGFPKDAPSNLAWLVPKLTDDLDAFRLTFDLATAKNQAPKMTVTFQGDGGNDGLAGWTLIVRPAGDGKAQASLERYDREVHSSAPTEFAWAAEIPLVLAYENRRVSVRLANATLFADEPIRPIPGKRRIGFATWGPQLRVAGVEIDAPKK